MLRWGRVGGCAVAACCALVGLPAVGALAGGGEQLHPGGKPAFVPRVGDWEAVSHGFHASLQLVANAGNHVFGGAGYGVYDVTITAPSTCPGDRGNFSIESQGTRRSQLVVGPDGSFPYRGEKRLGAFRSRSRATLSTSYFASSGSRKCSGRLRWKLHPARRRPVADGRWTLSFAPGAGGHTIVSDGGRAASLSLPKLAAACPGGPGGSAVGGIEVFIPANGRVDQTVHETRGARVRLLLTFTGRRTGRGRFVATQPGCRAGTLGFKARRG